MIGVKFSTLGCKVNQYETQSLREQFLHSGCYEVSSDEPADIYIINSCTVTHRADRDSLRFIRQAKQENPRAKIVLTGCLAQLESDRAKISGFGCMIIKDKSKILPAFIQEINKKNTFCGVYADNTWNGVKKSNTSVPGITGFKGHTRAFLKVQDGCNNFCSYCKVPLVRGRSKSVPLDQVIHQAEDLAKNGFKEIVLTGICLGDYGRSLHPRSDLASLIDKLEGIPGVYRIRLSSIEAKDISTRLINRMKGSKKLCRHLHIPLQSGDDQILEKMNRHYSRRDFLRLIQRIRSQVPYIAITTDLLVGFPGETEESFQNSVKAVQEIVPLKAHIFPFSLRKGTAAAGFTKDFLPEEVIKNRLMFLKGISDKCALSFRRKFLNKKMLVLIEDRARNNPGFWQGHTDNYLQVMVKSRLNLKNQLIPVKLTELVGEVFIGK